MGYKVRHPPCACGLKLANKNWLKMERVDRGPTSLVGVVGSEEDKEIDQSCSSTNKVWG